MSATTRLIVNADDFGIADAVNRGIAEAHDRGIVTSASIMATGQSFEHAVALARERPKLGIGVHLVLTEQRPLAGGVHVPTLVGRDGRFAPHAVELAGRQLGARISLRDVKVELDAQIRRVRAAGLAVTHLDGHQHVHVLPGVARVVAELAATHGIAAVRYPAEHVRAYMLRSPRGLKRLAEQTAVTVCCAVSPLHDLRRSDDFVGFYFGGRLDETNLTTVLDDLPPGRTIELMCHPGQADMRADGWRYAWAAELAALTSPRIRELLAARGVQLISYRDV
jgi:hopanoid biosynthesis associated protein HpnK